MSKNSTPGLPDLVTLRIFRQGEKLSFVSFGTFGPSQSPKMAARAEIKIANQCTNRAEQDAATSPYPRYCRNPTRACGDSGFPRRLRSDSCVDAPLAMAFAGMGLIGCFHMSGLCVRHCRWPLWKSAGEVPDEAGAHLRCSESDGFSPLTDARGRKRNPTSPRYPHTPR
jgi:hypothetical protein